MNKRKILNDPIYGFVTIPSDLVFDLIEHRYFQRLRRIKQLGLTHYVYPGALHTRFHHALGAMHLMGQAIQALRLKGHQISAEEEEGARVAILLHDIGHGPYSHALEHLFLPWSHEDLTLEFMHALNEEFNGQLDLAISIFAGTYERKFLTQLVTGQLDVDRLDYLKRDSFYTGVAEGVIGHDRIIAMLNVANDQIVVEEKALFSIEKFLVARRIMYLQVYLHKAVISAEQMVRKALELVLNESTANAHLISTGITRLALLRDSKGERPSREVLEAFAALDDVDVDYTLKSLGQSKSEVLRLLSNGLIRRRLFKTMFSKEPFAAQVYTQTVQMVVSQFGIPEAMAAQLVITGSERVPTYDPRQGEILMLVKGGRLASLPELLETSELQGVHNRHYLCYPVRKNEGMT